MKRPATGLRETSIDVSTGYVHAKSDPRRSTARRAVFPLGRNRVVLCVQVRFAFALEKTRSLPVLMRLYRRTRPRYRQKRTPSFADMLTCLRMTSLHETVFQDPAQKPPAERIWLSLT